MNTADIDTLLWLLFSDANARFNTLIEECAHLQDTIYGYLSGDSIALEIVRTAERQHEAHEAGSSRQREANAKDDDPSLTPLELLKRAGIQRCVVVDVKEHPRYPEMPSQDRSLIYLWNSLGSLIVGLVANQHQLRVQFKRAFCEVTAAESTGKQLYWFICMRGYFLSTAFGFYTRQLEHAHEKIVQVLENRPAALPAPILLRRWNSAQYGEFLSAYSRHVNWETSVMIGKLRGEQMSDIERRRRRDYINHTWTHQPTSRAERHVVSLSGQETFTLGSIRSAYFYLEQTILFPLIYHECAHLNFPGDEEVGRNQHNPEGRFFADRIEAAETLRQATFQSKYENFWHQFTEEVWADAVSIALCGRAYVVALGLQLMGLSGHRAYSHYNTDHDEPHELVSLATSDKRQFSAQFPEEDEDFFWEARLRLAIRVCQGLTTTSDGVLNSLDHLIDRWFASGADVFSVESTSNEHSQLWKYRGSLNQWAIDTTWRYLRRHVHDLRRHEGLSARYELPSVRFQGAARSAVDAYCKRAFQREHEGFEDVGTRLEDLSITVRWHIGKLVVGELKGCVGEGRFDHWTRAFASWLINDGATAFRLGLEWVTLRYSMLDALRDIQLGATRPPPSTRLAPGVSRTRKSESIWTVLQTMPRRLGLSADDIREWLLKQRITDKAAVRGETAPKRVQQALAEIDAIADSAIEAMVFGDSVDAGMRVGTLTIGVIRPSEVANANPSSNSPYGEALARVRDYFEACVAEVRERAKEIVTPDLDAQTLPLVGEYQFLSLLRGTTPVERDAYPRLPPQMLRKPRLVLQAFGGDFPKIDARRELVGQVTLLHFRYRWQWYDLLLQLKDRANSSADYQLFVSSAWEDAVLVTWHSSASADQGFWDGLEELSLSVDTDLVDPQSNLIVSRLENRRAAVPIEVGVSEGSTWIEWFARWAQQSGRVLAINDRTGRADYTIVWKGDDDKKSAANEFADTLLMLPAQFWSGVSGFSSSYERHRFVDPTLKGLPKTVLVSTISIHEGGTFAGALRPGTQAG